MRATAVFLTAGILCGRRRVDPVTEYIVQQHDWFLARGDTVHHRLYPRNKRVCQVRSGR